MRRRLVVRWLAVAGLLAGCGGGHHAGSAPATTDAGATTTGAPPSTPAPPTSPAPSSTAAPTTAVAPGPAGGPVPAGFAPQSATFVSVEQGWVLGTAACSSAPCTSMVRTSDGGAHWVGVPAPRDALTAPGGTEAGVREVRFADGLDGWVYGPDLWSTHDGGANWQRVSLAAGVPQVVDLEAAAGSAYALVTFGCSTQASEPCPASLWRSPAGSDDWTRVSSVDLPDGAALGALSLHGSTGYIVAASGSGQGSTLWRTSDGTDWSTTPSPCPAPLEAVSLAAIDQVRAALLCAGNGAAGSTAKALFATSDGGRTFVPEGTAPPFGGDGGTLGAASPATLALATESGATEIYRSSDGGSTWQTVLQLSDGGAGWGDFGFTDATHGLAVHAPAARAGGSAPGTGPDASQLLLSADGGLTWHAATF